MTHLERDRPNGAVRVLPDLEALSRAAAEALIEAMATAPEPQRFALALAGGGTPQRLYELLAGPYRTRVAWHRLYLFWGDERLVPPDDPASNYGAARKALLRRAPLPPDHVFPIPTACAPPACAAAYQATLKQFFGTSEPAFDLALLGLGADGHTASLFPENTPQRALAQEAAPWVEAVEAPPRYAVRPRITLTLQLLNRSRRVFFLVSGAEKQAPLRAILDEAGCTLPAAFVRAQEQLTWFVDEAAFGEAQQAGR